VNYRPTFGIRNLILENCDEDILASGSSVIDLTADLRLQTDKCPKEAGSHLALG
jgi:hypothetical protein